MTISALSANDIAEHQLLAALRLWSEGDYLSALTLAGAAEEILGKRLRKLGREPSFDQLKDLIVALAKQEGDDDPNTDRLVGSLLNDTRNALKCRIPDDCIDSKRYPLFMARDVMRVLIEQLQAEGATPS